MEYKKIYDNLIFKAKSRNSSLSEYYESHHIIPRSIGGSDLSDNIVKLTYKEHYFAHKLLVEIYPGNKSLITALWLMTITTNKALEKYNKTDYNLSDIEKHCLVKRTKNNLKISSREYEYCRKLYVNSMINHDVDINTCKKISEMTKTSMMNASIIEKCRAGSKGCKHYYNIKTHESHKWFPGDPDIDLNVYSWGRPPMSNEQKEKLKNSKNINKKTFHNDNLQINYVCYYDEIDHMIDGWGEKKKEYHNNLLFKNIIKDVKFNLINRNYFYNDILFFYPSAINKGKRCKQVIAPGLFVVCYDILLNWKNNPNIVEDLSNFIITHIKDIEETNKAYFRNK